MAALPALTQTMTIDQPRPPPPAFQGSGRNQGIERDRLLKPEDVPHDLMCSICLGVVADQSSETPCGHLFCTECIRSSLRRNPQCPLDKKPLQVGQLRSIREHNLPIPSGHSRGIMLEVLRSPARAWLSSSVQPALPAPRHRAGGLPRPAPPRPRPGEHNTSLQSVSSHAFLAHNLELPLTTEIH